MYWVINPVDGFSSVAAFQTPTSGGWIVVVGLCVVLAYSGVIAWRRRSRSAETTPEEPSESTSTSGLSVLTSQERVIELLESNGGRMRQTRIVEETGWSKAKVSMLLSEMESEGTISKLRVGRENIISQSGCEPDATRPPLEPNA